MEAIPELKRASQIESKDSQSCMLNLEQDEGDGLSLTSSMLIEKRASLELAQMRISRGSREQAELMMKSGGNSTFLLAKQIESLRDMER